MGRQLAIDFAREGVVGISLVARSVQALNEVRNTIYEIAPKTQVILIAADVTKHEDIERVVATTLSEFNGHLDVLINNASSIGPSPMPYLLDYPLEDFRNVINTGLSSYMDDELDAQHPAS